MRHVTVTYIRLRSPWLFFKLSLHGLRVTLQLKNQPGFLKMKNTGFGYDHYTMSLWESREHVQQFMRDAGAHRVAMSQSKDIATDLKVVTYPADSLPDWKDAKERVRGS